MTGQTDINESRLPDAYDELVSVDRLRHGEHNVRRVTPSDTLKRSIEADGIDKPLVTRRTRGDSDILHITDGWKRYQAAFDLGWRRVPVNIYDETLEALEAAERNSIVDEWTTYQIARHVQSLYQECQTKGLSESELISHIGERTRRSDPTVQRYLNAFELPAVLHPLLKEPQNVSDAEYRPLKNEFPDVRQYNGISWQVAEELGSYCGDVDDDKIITVALHSMKYNSDNAKKIVHEVLSDDTDTSSIQMAEYKLFNGSAPDQESRMLIPRFTMRLDPDKREAVIDHLQARKLHLTDAVEERFREFADDVESRSASSKPLDRFD